MSKRQFVMDLVCITLIIGLMWVFRCGVIVGDSMCPTYEEGDLFIYNIFNSVSRDDVVVFDSDSLGEKLIKRVIGVPGDTVSIHDNMVYLNSEAYPSFDYILEPFDTFYDDMPDVTLGENEYFVLGDNRNISMDSRFEEVGLVNGGNISGVVRYNLTQAFGITYSACRGILISAIFILLLWGYVDFKRFESRQQNIQ